MFVNESLLLEFAIARQGRHHPHGKREDKQKMNQQNKNKQTTVNEQHIQTFLYFGIEMLCKFFCRNAISKNTKYSFYIGKPNLDKEAPLSNTTLCYYNHSTVFSL
jgi:hypothetical protein